MRAAAHGADMRFIGGVTDKENITVIADPKITKPAELKGTRMAIDRLGDYSDFRARKVLESYGLEAQKDVFLLQIGGQTARFAALRTGQVQSTFVAPPLTWSQGKPVSFSDGSGGSRISVDFGLVRRHEIYGRPER